MKKQIVISDINFIDPDNDSVSSKNLIKNLLGNYYFSSNKDQKYSWFYKLQTDLLDNKKSVVESESEIDISGDITGNNELITAQFDMTAWNKTGATQSSLDTLSTNINNILGKSYYYKISSNKNIVDEQDSEKIIKEYGNYYYDYNTAISLPIVPRTDEVTQKELDESLSLNSVATIEPFYNYYNKEFELISENNNEQILYNFYVLYYYLLENLNDTAKQKFLFNNVLPTLRQYNAFIQQIIDLKDKNILKELETFESDIVKKSILILPDAVKFLNDLEDKKNQQPFGIEIQIPSQPKQAIITAIGDTNAALFLEKVVLLNKLFDSMGDKAFVAQLFFKNDKSLEQKEIKKIPIASLNQWVKDISDVSSAEQIGEEQIIIFSKNEPDKESAFLQKIKKFLLQKKVDSIIQTNKRNFLDIVAGVPAYNEVLFFEIRKFDLNNSLEPIQNIIIPNTGDIDFYKYFDTQIAYDKQYQYDVIAWTMIIGNKYKFFDRNEEAPLKKNYSALKNNSSKSIKNNIQVGDSDYFKWIRIADVLSNLQYSQQDTIENFIDKNYDFFKGFINFKGVVKEKKVKTVDYTFNVTSEPNAINLSNLLNKSYLNNSPNNLYKTIINNPLSSQIAENILLNVEQRFSILFANLLNNSRINGTAKEFTLGYQISGPDSPYDIREAEIIDNKKYSYFSKEKITESDFIYKILDQFKSAGILDNTFDKDVLKNIFQYTGKDSDIIKKMINETINYIASHFVKDVEKFLNDGFNYSFVEVDLNKEPNYGLDELALYYPRFRAKKTSKKIFGSLQFGVLNYVDVVLAGLPYIDKTNVRVVSSPPPPPDVLPIPYKNVSDKIKFFLTDSSFTYRDYPINVIESVDSDMYKKLLENEKYKNNDGKITFRGDEPSSKFIVYRLEVKPKQYTDFENGESYTVDNLGGFEDDIQSNMKYYYTFRALDAHNMASNPSPVYEIEIVENSGAIYPIIKIINIEDKDIRVPIKSFRERFKIDINQEHILQNKNVDSALQLKGNDFGSLTPSVFNKKFKFRITSKSSKKKIDINVTFTRDFDTTLIQDTKNETGKKTKKVKA